MISADLEGAILPSTGSQRFRVRRFILCWCQNNGFSVAPPARLGNPSSRTANFMKLLNKLCLRHFVHASVAGLYLTPIMFRMWFACWWRLSRRSLKSAGRDKISEPYPLMNPLLDVSSKRFGMTFVEYARARRMGLALKHIRSGHTVIDSQLSTGYESSSGFRDAFSRIMGAAPTHVDEERILKAAWIDTRLGPMMAIADEQALYLLEFIDRRGLEREVERLRKRTKSAIVPGTTAPIQSIERELNEYFDGKRTAFDTTLFCLGTPFQKQVWEALLAIPAGETRSYQEIANAVGKPSACRAVAQANGANQLAIVIPCHRVINTSGELGVMAVDSHVKLAASARETSIDTVNRYS